MSIIKLRFCSRRLPNRWRSQATLRVANKTSIRASSGFPLGNGIRNGIGNDSVAGTGVLIVMLAGLSIALRVDTATAQTPDDGGVVLPEL
jgi:iron complex outermembrane receptor protein